jgi:hypothetical protein
MYLDVHRQCWDADASGTPLDINTRVRLVGDSEVRTFVTAWQRAGGYDENIRVAETAIKAIVTPLNAEPRIKAGLERWLLDFVRDYGRSVTARLTEIARARADPNLNSLSASLQGLLRTADGATAETPEFKHAAAGVAVAARDVVSRGFDLGRLQELLSAWSEATGGPRITVRISDQEHDNG